MNLPDMRRWLPLSLILLGVALGLYALFGSSDEDRIRERLDQLADAVRVHDGELNPIVRHGRIRQEFAEIFTKEASVVAPEVGEGLHGRDALSAAAAQLAGVYQSAHVSWGGVDIRIERGGLGAEVAATATITGSRHGQPLRRDERSVKLRLEEIDGDWKILSATVERGAGPDGNDL